MRILELPFAVLLLVAVGCAPAAHDPVDAVVGVLPFVTAGDAESILQVVPSLPAVGDELQRDLDRAREKLAGSARPPESGKAGGAWLPSRLSAAEDTVWKIEMIAVVAACALLAEPSWSEPRLVQARKLAQLLGAGGDLASRERVTAALQERFAWFEQQERRPEVLAALVQGLSAGPFVGKPIEEVSPNGTTTEVAYGEGLRLEAIEEPAGEEPVVLVQWRDREVLWRRRLSAATDGTITGGTARGVRPIGFLGFELSIAVHGSHGDQMARVYVSPAGELRFYVLGK